MSDWANAISLVSSSEEEGEEGEELGRISSKREEEDVDDFRGGRGAGAGAGETERRSAAAAADFGDLRVVLSQSQELPARAGDGAERVVPDNEVDGLDEIMLLGGHGEGSSAICRAADPRAILLAGKGPERGLIGGLESLPLVAKEEPSSLSEWAGLETSSEFVGVCCLECVLVWYDQWRLMWADSDTRSSSHTQVTSDGTTAHAKPVFSSFDVVADVLRERVLCNLHALDSRCASWLSSNSGDLTARPGHSLDAAQRLDAEASVVLFEVFHCPRVFLFGEHQNETSPGQVTVQSAVHNLLERLAAVRRRFNTLIGGALEGGAWPRVGVAVRRVVVDSARRRALRQLVMDGGDDGDEEMTGVGSGDGKLPIPRLPGAVWSVFQNSELVRNWDRDVFAALGPEAEDGGFSSLDDVAAEEAHAILEETRFFRPGDNQYADALDFFLGQSSVSTTDPLFWEGTRTFLGRLGDQFLRTHEQRLSSAERFFLALLERVSSAEHAQPDPASDDDLPNAVTCFSVILDQLGDRLWRYCPANFERGRILDVFLARVQAFSATLGDPANVEGAAKCCVLSGMYLSVMREFMESLPATDARPLWPKVTHVLLTVIPAELWPANLPQQQAAALGRPVADPTCDVTPWQAFLYLESCRLAFWCFAESFAEALLKSSANYSAKNMALVSQFAVACAASHRIVHIFDDAATSTKGLSVAVEPWRAKADPGTWHFGKAIGLSSLTQACAEVAAELLASVWKADSEILFFSCRVIGPSQAVSALESTARSKLSTRWPRSMWTFSLTSNLRAEMLEKRNRPEYEFPTSLAPGTFPVSLQIELLQAAAAIVLLPRKVLLRAVQVKDANWFYEQVKDFLEGLVSLPDADLREVLSGPWLWVLRCAESSRVRQAANDLLFRRGGNVGSLCAERPHDALDALIFMRYYFEVFNARFFVGMFDPVMELLQAFSDGCRAGEIDLSSEGLETKIEMVMQFFWSLAGSTLIEGSLTADQAQIPVEATVKMFKSFRQLLGFAASSRLVSTPEPFSEEDGFQVPLLVLISRSAKRWAPIAKTPGESATSIVASHDQWLPLLVGKFESVARGGVASLGSKQNHAIVTREWLLCLVVALYHIRLAKMPVGHATQKACGRLALLRKPIRELTSALEKNAETQQRRLLESLDDAQMFFPWRLNAVPTLRPLVKDKLTSEHALESRTTGDRKSAQESSARAGTGTAHKHPRRMRPGGLARKGVETTASYASSGHAAAGTSSEGRAPNLLFQQSSVRRGQNGRRGAASAQAAGGLPKNWFQRELLSTDLAKSIVSSAKRSVPDTFASAAEYAEIFGPLLLDNTRAELESERNDGAEPRFRANVVPGTQRSIDDFTEVSLRIATSGQETFKLWRQDTVLAVTGRTPQAGTARRYAVIRRPPQPSRRDGAGQVQVLVQFRFPNAHWASVFLRPSNSSHASLSLVAVGTLVTSERELRAMLSLGDTQFPRSISGPLLDPGQANSGLRPPGSQFFDAFLRAGGASLNTSQVSAVRSVLDDRSFFSLVQGPPGTGKTRTLVACVCSLVMRNREQSLRRKRRILVCAPSNAAVDEVTERLQDPALGGRTLPRVVRLGDPNSMRGSSLAVSLDTLAAALKQNPKGKFASETMRMQQEQSRRGEILRRLEELRQELQIARTAHVSMPQGDPGIQRIERELQRLRDEQVRLSRELSAIRAGGDNSATKRARRLEQELLVSVLEQSDVILCTLSTAGSEQTEKLLASLEISDVIIDEAAQAVELTTVIPLKFRPDHCTLVGDPKQLPATVFARDATRQNFDRSLFARLSDAGHDVKMLDVQHRMHPLIRAFPSRMFYDDRLQDGPLVARETVSPLHKDPLFAPFSFFDVQGRHALTSSSGGGASRSLCNEAEAQFVVAVLSKLVVHRVDLARSVAVISPYRQQVSLIRRKLARLGKAFSETEVGTVDGFQGREKDIVLVSTVRAHSKASGSVGFLSDVRRLNVSITRAKKCLLVVGNAQTLEVNSVWKQLINEAKRQSCFRVVNTDLQAFFKALSPDQNASHRASASSKKRSAVSVSDARRKDRDDDEGTSEPHTKRHKP